MTTQTMRPGELQHVLEARLAHARTKQPRRSRAAARGTNLHRTAVSAVVGAGVLLVGIVASTFAAANYINLTVDDAIVNYDGAVYAQGGVGAGTGNFDPFLTLSPSNIPHSDPAFTAQAGTEDGYNQCDDKDCPDDRGNSPYYYDQFFGGGRTHEVKVSAIPTLEYNGAKYREFSLDANDEGSDTWMSVDEIKIFTDTQVNLDDYVNSTESFGNDTGPAATKIFDMDDGPGGDTAILMVSQGLESGSGVSDITVLVPDNLFPAGCEYGSTTCDKYLYFWTAMGHLGTGNFDGVTCTQNPCNWDVSAGFEEWRIRFLPVVNVSKTADVSFTRDYSWSVEKSVDPATLDLFDGDTADVTWSVTPTRDGYEDSDFTVSGTITVFNPTGADPIPKDIDAEILSIEDVLTLDGVPHDLGPGDIDCGVTFPYTLEPQETLECTYEYEPTGIDGESSGENVATVTIESGIPVNTGGGISFAQQVDYEGMASVDFSTATPTELDATATLTDDRGPLNKAAVSGQEETYEETFACGADEGTHDNTARVTEDDSGDYDEDSASVTVNCYDLSVEKTAVESNTRTYTWDIDKSVDPATWDLFTGDTGTSEYTVTITSTGYTDSAWHVEGDITITNNHPSKAADLNSVTDSISGFGAATVNCPASSVPANDSIVCTYSADLPNGNPRTNTATATQQNYDYDADGIASAGGTTDYQGTADVDFSEATTTPVNATVNVTDTYEGSLGSFTGSGGTATYTRQFACDDDEGQNDNTATITETGQSDDASVQVNCYQLSVSKDADESYTRTYEWSIDKSADQDSLELMPGESFTVNYSVTVDVAGYEDSDYHVEGDITISNPHPTLDADLTDVTDEIFDGIDATVVCPSMTVPADGELVCTYSSDLPDGTDRLNAATATQQNYDYDKDLQATASGTTDYTGNADIEFGDPTDLVDACVDVNDTLAGFLGTVCVDDTPPPPTTFDYPIDLGPYTEADCGEFDVPNTADFLTNDTGASDEAMWNVHITIPCPEGCTLTQGYWKTHSEYGPAPTDPNWYLIGDVDGDAVSEGPDEDFFDTGMSWYEVFWTSPAGRPYYQLAHQWMAAYLNTVSIQAIGGSVPSNVQTALVNGASLLDEYDGSPNPNKNPDIKGKDAKDIRGQFVSIAGVLGSFNEGTIGPGHCDEPLVVSQTAQTSPLAGVVFLAPIGLIAPLAEWFRRRNKR